MVNKISNFAIQADKFMDKIPIVSTVNNIVNLAIKAFLFIANQRFENSYLNYLQEKSFAKCAILTLPIIGNILFASYTAKQAQEVVDKPQFKVGDVEKLPLNWQTDRDVAMKLVTKDSRALPELPAFQKDLEIIKAAIKGQKSAAPYCQLEKDLRANEELLRFALKESGSKWSRAIMEAAVDANPAFADRKDLFKIAIGIDGEALKCGSVEVRDDSELVLDAVKDNADYFRYASDNKKRDKTFITEELIPVTGFWVMKHVDPALSDDKEVGLKAVTKDGYALPFLSKRLQKDPDIIIAAGTKTPSSLADVLSEDLTEEVVLTLAQNNPESIKYIQRVLNQELVNKMVEVMDLRHLSNIPKRFMTAEMEARAPAAFEKERAVS